MTGSTAGREVRVDGVRLHVQDHGVALTASLNWYRANLAPEAPRPAQQVPSVRTPTLAIWSNGDHYLCEDRVADSGRFVSSDWKYQRVDGASQWIQIDTPDPLNELLLQWIT